MTEKMHLPYKINISSQTATIITTESIFSALKIGDDIL